MTKKSLIIISLLLLLFLTSKAQNEKKIVLSTLPDIDVYDINGVHTTLHQLAKNKVLLIDCWFIPCPPCFIALGALQRIHAQYINNKNVCFITICMTDSSLVKKFIRQDTTMSLCVSSYQFLSSETNFNLPVYFIPGCRSTMPLNAKVLHGTFVDESNCPGAAFGFQAYPTCMVFNKRGKQVYKETGFDIEDKYTQRLTKALNEALADNN
jgi:thiol-disulfide isomerase/thioredoxin